MEISLLKNLIIALEERQNHDIIQYSEYLPNRKGGNDGDF